MGDTTGLSYSEVDGIGTSVYMDGIEKIVNNRPRRAKNKIEIIAGKKQTIANNEIYYVMHLSENKTPTTSDQTNRSAILISS